MRSTEAQLRLRRMSKLSLVRMVQSAKLVIVSTRKPSLTMAEFISNSAILTAVRPNAVLTAAYSSSPRHEKWQTSLASLPLLSSRRMQLLCCTLTGRMPPMRGTGLARDG